LDIISNMSRFLDLDPLVRIAICLSIAVAALVTDSMPALLLLIGLTAVIASEARVTKGWKAYLRFSVWAGALLVLLNLVLSQGGERVLFEAQLGIPVFESLRITEESLIFGLAMALRLIAVVSAFAVLSLSISPTQMVSAMSRLRLPARSVFVTSLAARFMPSLMEDAKELADVQRARGAKVRGVRSAGPVIIPLLSNSLERSVSVAEAMEARGFSGRFEE
jgi:energy-coupling factor transporter transmembrane protein EcfT